MRKIILPIILLSGLSVVATAQQQWDRPMKLKSFTIDIKADMFTAITFIEMEFSNPNKKEIEGLYQFRLNAGQVITAFQLDLNGKYRDGSIEEKWKATNTYNTIVGKRIDPALLTMDYSGNYSLRIYPVPANGTRKVTMTIQQMLSPENENLTYSLPMNVNDTVTNFRLNISVLTNKIPFARTGIIANRTFAAGQNQFQLNWQTEKIRLNKAITFSIPFSKGQLICSKKVSDKTSFALQFHPTAATEYDIHPKIITVFWDASASSSERNINKEISFLRQFISFHKVEQLTIIPFNHKIIDTVVFNTKDNSSNQWRQYLDNLNYDGATQLGLLDLSSTKTEMFLLFSDGKNSYGKNQPANSRSHVSCIYTSGSANVTLLQKITGTNGGRIIDLNKISLTEAITASSRGVNWLMDITSVSGTAIIEQSLPKKISTAILLTGTTTMENDTLYFHFGNSSLISFTEKVVITNSGNFTPSTTDRISLLSNFEELIHTYSWSNMIDFGLKEKVVTPHTAYIVLERTEDYIKYNIAPPKELEAECERMNYVKRDTRFERKQIEKLSDYDMLNNVINSYNERIKKWDANEKPLHFIPAEFDKSNRQTQSEEIPPSVSLANNALPGNAAGLIAFGNSALNEVIVTGYGNTLRKNLTSSVSYITRQDIFRAATSVEEALQGRVAGVQVTRSGSPGNAGFISIRGAASLNSNKQPLFVIDGIRVSGNINDMVNMADIEYITVLKDGTAAAIYGSGAANGVILIETKKGRRSYGGHYNNKSYRLKDMEDVEYIQELKSVIAAEKIEVYEKLKEEYKNEPAFYFDVAQHFLECGLLEAASTILMNAIENANGDAQILTGIAYILENGKRFTEAINIYEQLIQENSFNLTNYRNLAWAYYQSGRYQQAVNIFFTGIKLNTGQEEYLNTSLKTTMLYEMNAVIAIHKNNLDLAAIPTTIIKPLPVDLRIVIDDNYSGHGSLRIREPNGFVSSITSPSKNGGMLLQDGQWRSVSLSEYQIKKAVAGKYKIVLNYYGGYSYSGRIPSIVRITKFKNFGYQNQSIEIENVMMDNQNGEIEIGEVKWQ